MNECDNNKRWRLVCCREVEKKLGWGPPSQWGNDDFERLAEQIFETTGIRLSLSTMKRLWGRVNYDHFPSPSTLHALATFLGYPDWRTFCHEHPLEMPATPIAPASDPVAAKKKPGPRAARLLTLGSWLSAAVLPWLVAVVLLANRHQKTQSPPPRYSYRLSARKMTNDLPNSVVFTYDANVAGNPKVMIQQSWDTTRRELVNATAGTHTSLYYYPGYFSAKLLVNDEIVREIPVFIPTRGWTAIAERTPLPLYFSDRDFHQGEAMGISAALLRGAFHTTDFNDKWVQFSNIREFSGISGNDFRFQTRFQNTASVEESICRKVRIVILGTEDVIILPFATRGCIANLYLYAGGYPVSGKDNDLSGFGCDFTREQSLDCTVNKQRITITLNDVPIYSAAHRGSLGEIVGVRLFFEGPGRVGGTKLSSPGGASYVISP